MTDQSSRSSKPSPALVALAAWIVPGSGYLLLKEKARGLTIGISVLALFFLGLLVGGIRCLDVPGFNVHGQKTYFYELRFRRDGEERLEARSGDKVPEGAVGEGWTLVRTPVDELRSKPWSIPQIMMGPIDVLCDWWAIAVSPPADISGVSADAFAARSHSRVNELGVLFTAVAGMLNLMAIIDSSHRASHTEEA
jgi:hypothetical protein